MVCGIYCYLRSVFLWSRPKSSLYTRNCDKTPMLTNTCMYIWFAGFYCYFEMSIFVPFTPVTVTRPQSKRTQVCIYGLWDFVAILKSLFLYSGLNMMTSSNGTIFRVTGHFLGEFPAQRPVTRSFDVFFDLRLKKPLSKQPWGWWFETLSCLLWGQCNEPSANALRYLTHCSLGDVLWFYMYNFQMRLENVIWGIAGLHVNATGPYWVVVVSFISNNVQSLITKCKFT